MQRQIKLKIPLSGKTVKGAVSSLNQFPVQTVYTGTNASFTKEIAEKIRFHSKCLSLFVVSSASFIIQIGVDYNTFQWGVSVVKALFKARTLYAANKNLVQRSCGVSNGCGHFVSSDVAVFPH